MITPRPGLNGDKPNDLLNQLTDARIALLDAVEVMKKALPHARNYIWEPEMYAEDRARAERRIAAAQDLAEEYYQDAINLLED